MICRITELLIQNPAYCNSYFLFTCIKLKQLNKQIVFFDFDGTLTHKDTLWQMAMLHKGKWGIVCGCIVFGPTVVAHKLGLISAQTAKEAVLKFYFGGMELVRFEALCLNFTKSILPELIRPLALKQIEEYRNAGVEMVIVSASLENWVQPWATQQGIKTIGSKAELVDGKITGKLNGLNCNGKEKVTRITYEYELAHYEHIIVFGDSSGDTPMLSLGHQTHYKPFR